MSKKPAGIAGALLLGVTTVAVHQLEKQPIHAWLARHGHEKKCPCRATASLLPTQSLFQKARGLRPTR